MNKCVMKKIARNLYRLEFLSTHEVSKMALALDQSNL